MTQQIVYSLRFAKFIGCFMLVAPISNLSAQQSDSSEAELEEILVIGTPPDRYEAGRSDSLTGFSLDFMELPRIVDTIPEQLILDQKIGELGEALRNSPGVSLGDGFGGTNDDFYMRGFRRNTVYRDGFRRRSNLKTNTTNIERVEVIKGPASIGFGQVEPGGLVNIVTKTPLDESRTYAELRSGSWNNNLALIDVSRPVNDVFAFRVNASFRDSNSFRDLTEITQNVFAGTGKFQFSDRTALNVSAEYRDESGPLDRGTIAVPVAGGTRAIVDTPRSRRFGEAFEEFNTKFMFFGLSLEHEINDSWRVLAGAAAEKSDANDTQVRPRQVFIFDQSVQLVDGFFVGPPVASEPIFDEPTDQIWLARRVDGSHDRKVNTAFLNVKLIGSFDSGSVAHQVAFSADYQDYEQTRIFGSTPNTNGVTTPLFDINNPVYGQLSPGFSSIIAPQAASKEYSFAAQDYLRFSDQWAALVGARVDSIDIDGSGPLESVSEVSPQVAVLFSATPNISFFASYSEAFKPNTILSVDNDGNVSTADPFDPENSKQTELGVKAQLYDGKLRLSAAVFDISKENVVEGSGDEARLVDGQDSKGVEIGVGGQPIPGMNIVAGYAYTDTNVSSGNRPVNVPETMANLWVSYEIQEGGLAGFGIGGGAFYSGDRFGDSNNSWSLGDYTLIDASIWYNLPFSFSGRDESLPTRIQVSGKNLTDEIYYSASGTNNGQRINIGSPRAWFLSLSTRW